MKAARRPFNRAAFLASYRARCVETGLDPATGNPTACADPRWWINPAYWMDAGPAHSVVERDAIASIAAQARAAYGLKAPPTLEQVMTAEFRAVVKEALEEDRAARRADLPLRELHALRGETVIDIEGMRVLVPIKVA